MVEKGTRIMREKSIKLSFAFSSKKTMVNFINTTMETYE